MWEWLETYKCLVPQHEYYHTWILMAVLYYFFSLSIGEHQWTDFIWCPISTKFSTTFPHQFNPTTDRSFLGWCTRGKYIISGNQWHRSAFQGTEWCADILQSKYTWLFPNLCSDCYLVWGGTVWRLLTGEIIECYFPGVCGPCFIAEFSSVTYSMLVC